MKKELQKFKDWPERLIPLESHGKKVLNWKTLGQDAINGFKLMNSRPFITNILFIGVDTYKKQEYPNG